MWSTLAAFLWWIGIHVAVLGFVMYSLIAAVLVRIWHDDRVCGEARAASRRTADR